MAFDTVLGIAAQCAWWPRDAANARASAPVSRGSIPVLVVSGVYDPITPVAFGNEVAAYLNAPHLVVNAAAHGAVGTRCGVEALADFLESPGPLPTTPCLAQMRPVFTPVEPVNDPVPTTPAG
jgi:pimeloyl-ACP methyl ester carboxylesterase